MSPTEPSRATQGHRTWRDAGPMRTVWVTAWELQCCGDPFEVGADIAWSVSEAVDEEWLSATIGNMAGLVTDVERHHDGDDIRELRGTVTQITAAWCQYQPISRRGRTLVPVHGSETFESRERADGWEPEGADRRFLGYLVEVDQTHRPVAPSFGVVGSDA